MDEESCFTNLGGDGRQYHIIDERYLPPSLYVE